MNEPPETLKTLADKYDAMAADIEQIQRDYNDLEVVMHGMEKRQCELVSERDEAEKKYAEACDKICRLTVSLEAAEADIADRQLRQREAYEHNCELIDKLTKVEQEHANACNLVGKLTVSLEESKVAANTLRERIVEMQDAQDKLEQRMKAAFEERDDARQLHSETKEELEQVKEDLSATESNLCDVERQIAKLENAAAEIPADLPFAAQRVIEDYDYMQRWNPCDDRTDFPGFRLACEQSDASIDNLRALVNQCAKTHPGLRPCRTP